MKLPLAELEGNGERSRKRERLRREAREKYTRLFRGRWRRKGGRQAHSAIGRGGKGEKNSLLDLNECIN